MDALKLPSKPVYSKPPLLPTPRSGSHQPYSSNSFSGVETTPVSSSSIGSTPSVNKSCTQL